MAPDEVQNSTLLWERMQLSGRNRALTHGQIARAAIGIADDSGLDDVTMRTVAIALGAGTMSLYRYVASRDELELLMVDVIAGGLTLPSRLAVGWRPAARAVAQRTRDALTAHPWLTMARAAWPGIGPGGLGWTSQCLAAIGAGAGAVPEEDRARAVAGTLGAVIAFTMGYTRQELTSRIVLGAGLAGAQDMGPGALETLPDTAGAVLEDTVSDAVPWDAGRASALGAARVAELVPTRVVPPGPVDEVGQAQRVDAYLAGALAREGGDVLVPYRAYLDSPQAWDRSFGQALEYLLDGVGAGYGLNPALEPGARPTWNKVPIEVPDSP